MAVDDYEWLVLKEDNELNIYTFSEHYLSEQCEFVNGKIIKFKKEMI